MQAIEIPDKKDNEVHIILKRDRRDVKEPKYVTQEMFQEFASKIEKGMQDLMNKMNGIEDLVLIIANQQQKQQDAQHSKHYTEERSQDHEYQEHEAYPIMIQHDGNNHSQEEIEHGMEDEDGIETEEYIVDVDDEYVRQTDSEMSFQSTGKRRESNASKSGPNVKKIKQEIIPIQNFMNSEPQSTEEIIIEAAAANQNIQDNVDSEEVVANQLRSFLETKPEPIEIKIQHDTRYEIVAVTEELEFDFPLTTLDQLKKLNNLLSNDERAVEAMKHKLTEISASVEYNFQRALQKVIADNLMHQLNWQGT
uniref:CSON011109 protein n=1 Tax=Culicoides sonorensis TaxID=179676 RepID=A0A336LPU0_CULSO